MHLTAQGEKGDKEAAFQACDFPVIGDETFSICVNGKRCEFPTHALRAALADLRLSRGEYVSAEDYASSVSVFLSALKGDFGPSPSS